MALGEIIFEWSGFQQFPHATQTKLLELLERLKKQGVHTLTILVLGKCGVGKSSTVNSITKERVVSVSAFQSEVLKPVLVSRMRDGFTLNIIDSPGLVVGGYVNDQALEIIKRSLLNKTIDVLLYVDRLDAYRVDTVDMQVVKAITDSFGKGIWQRSIVVLTHAQFSPPDGLDYGDFFYRRSSAVLNVVRQGAGIRKHDFQILPNGIAWIPNLFERIVKISSDGSKPIFVDKMLMEGPNPNDRGKIFIPFILGFQYLFVKWIQRGIKDDIAKVERPLWEKQNTEFADKRKL